MRSPLLSFLYYAGVMLLPAVALFGQAPSEAQYKSSLNAALDSLTARWSQLPRHPVIFNGNINLAHGLAIKRTPIKALFEYIDGLKAAGVQRIEFNPGLSSIDDPAAMEKYDLVVKHIREAGLPLEINPVYANIGNMKSDVEVQNFRQFAGPAVKACAGFAGRYHPEYLVVVHEPVTMAARMRLQVRPHAWAAYVQAAIRAVKQASPSTRVGAGGVYYDLPNYQAFAAIPELDFLTMDIYDEKHFDIYDQMAQIAHTANKPVFIEETWRTAFIAPGQANALHRGIEPLSIKGTGNGTFEELDAKWIRAIALYASTHQIEAITPFWTQALFLYVTSGPDHGTDGEYNQRVIQALDQGQHTKLFDVYRSLVQEFGKR